MNIKTSTPLYKIALILSIIIANEASFALAQGLVKKLKTYEMRL